MKIAVFPLFFLLQSGFSYAGDVVVGSFNIESIRISDSTDSVYVKPVSNIEVKNNSCLFADFYALAPSDALFNQMYSLLLSAASANKKVKVWVSDTLGDCKTGRQRIRLVEVAF